MKLTDIDRLQAEGLISAEQHRAIVERFRLDREGNKLLAVFSIIGAVLVASGVILLIAANWEEIPRFIKLLAALALMLGAHYGGWRLQQGGRHPIVGEALHLVGAMLFLGNIALVGQIYNLSSRPPNAILLWLVGIAPLPWLLRSKAQFVLTLLAFGLWLGLELNQSDGWLYFGGEARQFMFYALLGVLFAGLGMWLGRTRYPEFGPVTEKFGLLVMHIAACPLTLGWLYGSEEIARGAWLLAGGVTAVATLLLGLSVRDKRLLANRQWRWTWAAALLAVMGLIWAGLIVKAESPSDLVVSLGSHWVAVPVLFLFCLIQIQVGLLRRSPWLVNVAITFLGLHIVITYFQLFGTMQTTGLMFVITGLFLIGLAFYLERQRRALLKRMNAAPPTLPTN